MAIDPIGRAKLQESRKQKEFLNGIKDAMTVSQKKEDPELDSLMGAPFKEVLRLAAKKDGERELLTVTNKIGQALAKIYNKIPQSITLPRIFQVKGFVDSRIVSMPSVKVNNFSELDKTLQAIEKRLSQMATAISMIVTQPSPKPQEIKIPKFDTAPIVDAIKNIPSPSGENMSQDIVSALGRVEEGIAALYNKPQMTPQPVTSVNLNALQGYFKSTKLTVGTTPVPIPTTPLANRRSLIVYNGSDNTIYLGGSGVTFDGANQGLPIPSLTYSPPLDPGKNMILYGVANIDSEINVLEASNDSSGR